MQSREVKVPIVMQKLLLCEREASVRSRVGCVLLLRFKRNEQCAATALLLSLHRRMLFLSERHVAPTCVRNLLPTHPIIFLSDQTE